MGNAIPINKNTISERRFFSYLRHILQREYGYIPYEEWKNMTYPEIMLMVYEIQREYEEIERSYKFMRNNTRGAKYGLRS